MPDPEELRIDANGITFGALSWGAQDAPLALLIHGYPDTAWTWRHLGPYLAERGWRAVAPFTRGYSPTSPAPSDRYRIADLADDVLALHAALGGDDRAALIGHDWGAITTWAASTKAPDRFARYVGMSVPPPVALLKAWTSPRTLGVAARQLRMSWYLVFNQLPIAERAQSRVIPRLWRDWSPGYDATEDVRRTLAALQHPEHLRAAVRYYRNNLQGGIKALFTTKPGAPVLYLHGERDGCIQAALPQLYPELFVTGSRIEVLPGAGHFLQLEQPDVVNALIAGWLQRAD
ncbi:alpha/beta fold hydrolase [Paraconexibacter sp.]|uniref:alpha/beta fold hydrolase n=1 Tax=Paraconexibacter sp. TaxID=2949640 RepID=UPI003561770F